MKPLLEWEKRAIGEAKLTRPIADQLLAVARGSSLGGLDGTRILVDAGRFIRAQNIVGVIASGEHALEILPKIDGLEDEGARERLIHMLATVHDLEIATGLAADLGIQRETMLEVLIRLFADRLIDTVRHGLPRRYIEHDEDLPSLRGRMDMVRQFTTLAASPWRLACRFDALSSDVLLNRIMKAAIQCLRRVASHTETQRRLAELAMVYADVGDLPSRCVPWSMLNLDRTDRRWGPLVRLARLLLDGDYQTTSSGQVTGTALLFDMGHLFESYVAKMLQRAFRGHYFQIIAQGGLRYCMAEIGPEGQSGRQTFQTRPDILVKLGSEIHMIIDTKWKRLRPRVDDAKRGVSQGDVYQMMAYARLYATSKLMLLYPHHGGLEAPGVLERYALAQGTEQLLTATVNLFDLASTASQLRALVLSAYNP